MTSRSATVLVIFVIAVIAFCLASVFGAMTGTISILPNESESNGGILDNLSAITDGTGDSGVRYGSDDSDHSSSSSSNVETTQDSSSQSGSSSSSGSSNVEHTTDKPTASSDTKDTTPSSSSNPSSGSSSSSSSSSNPNVETTTG